MDHTCYHWLCERLQEELVQDPIRTLVNLEFELS